MDQSHRFSHDGRTLVAVDCHWEAAPCMPCHFYSRGGALSRKCPGCQLPSDDQFCYAHQRRDHRTIYWALAPTDPEPNPL